MNIKDVKVGDTVTWWINPAEDSKKTAKVTQIAGGQNKDRRY